MPNHTSVGHALPDGLEYQRRTPETTVLYRVVQHHLESFLASARDQGLAVPRFVERELRAFLDCGLLCRGFLRVRCQDCGRERLVASSCKTRGFCPSCGARRMADTAAHLVDRVFSEVPVRQYVLSLPFAVRTRLAFDQELCSQVSFAAIPAPSFPCKPSPASERGPAQQPTTAKGDGAGPPLRRPGPSASGKSAETVAAPHEERLVPGPAPFRGRRLPWSELLHRVFAVDAFRCDHCAGRMRQPSTSPTWSAASSTAWARAPARRL